MTALVELGGGLSPQRAASEVEMSGGGSSHVAKQPLAVDVTMDVDRASAAQRRRGRRLHAALRHERLSVAMAKFTHHTLVRGWPGPGREEGASCSIRRSSGRPSPPQTELLQLFDEEPGGVRPAEPWGAARAGSAAHRGADYRDIRAWADSRCTCAAYSGPAGGRPQDPRHLDSCRAGRRCAQDQFSAPHPVANPDSRAAAGGAVGGSGRSLTFQFLPTFKVSSQLARWWRSSRFSPGQVSTASSSVSLCNCRAQHCGWAVGQGFSHFSLAPKKCEGCRALECGAGCAPR